MFHSLSIHGRLLALCIACTVSLVGCATEPAYVRPKVQVPADYKNHYSAPMLSAWRPARPQLAADRGEWWSVFGDARLNTLEQRVTLSNQGIRKALAGYQQAQALAAEARSDYMPTIGAGVAISRNRTSNNVVGRSLAGKTVSDFDTGLDATWEPDLFDRIGHEVDAAQARAQASQSDLAAVSLSMHAELAVDYIQLRSLDIEAKLLQDTLTDDARASDIVQQRVLVGVAPPSDLAEANSVLEATHAQLIDLRASRARYEDAIATLIGVPASNFVLPVCTCAMQLPTIPYGLPSALLERRPDIAAAERRVAAANADVGEAESAFFPDLVLSASGGMESSRFAQWASLPSHFWSIGPALVGTIFDGGRRKHALQAAESKRDSETAAYRQTVLGAFQDVEDQLASLDTLSQEITAQQLAVSDADQAMQSALNRYQAGAIDYLEVAILQTTYLTQERDLNAINTRRLVSDVLLVKSLGGLWS